MGCGGGAILTIQSIYFKIATTRGMGWFSAVGGLGLGVGGGGGGGGKINHVQSIYFLEGTTNTILILAKFGQSCIPVPPSLPLYQMKI